MGSPPIWKFRPKTANDFSAEPIQDAFFESDESGGYNNALIRETIQNSLDAKIKSNDSDSVKIKISLNYDQNRINSDIFSPYICDLIPHLKAENNGLYKIPDFNDDVPYLLIADYGTTGLEGNYDTNKKENNPEEPDNFYYFWRKVGGSNKNSDERGRWGIGKAVYMRSSGINTYFGLTVRASDNKLLLMGQSVLKEHGVNGTDYLPYGHFGHFEENPECNFFPLPLKDENHIMNFQEVFKTNRTNKDSGLSVVIPYPDSEITSDGLAWAAITQYFYPVLTDDLCIYLTEDNNSINIDKNNISGEISKLNYTKSKYSEEELRELIKFTEWTINLDSDKFVCLKEQDPNYQPKWSENLFDCEILPDLRVNFENGIPLAFKVPIKVQPSGSEPQKSYFNVFLCRDNDLNRSDVYFIRQGITITSAATIRTKGIRALVIIENESLSSMLGDSENVAHTKWEHLNPRFRGQYNHGPTCLSFVKNSVTGSDKT